MVDWRRVKWLTTAAKENVLEFISAMKFDEEKTEVMQYYYMKKQHHGFFERLEEVIR